MSCEVHSGPCQCWKPAKAQQAVMNGPQAGRFQPSMCACPGIEHLVRCRYYPAQESVREKIATENWLEGLAAEREDSPLNKPADDSNYAASRAKTMGIPENQIAAFVLGWKLGSRRA